MLINVKIAEKIDAEAHGTLETLAAEKQALTKTMAQMISTSPDIRFVFPDSQVFYSRTSLLKSASTYFATLLTPEFVGNETRKWDKNDNAIPASIKVDDSDEDEEDEEEVRPVARRSSDPLRQVCMVTIKVKDFT